VDEADLIRCAQQGDQQAYGALVLAHQRFVYNLALRAVQNQAEAEDLAQEAFLRAWQALPGFRMQARFSTWLYRIVVNLAYNQQPRLRRELATLPVEDVEDWSEMRMVGDAAPGAGEKIELQERQAMLQREIKKLPASYQMMVMLRYQRGLAYDEIAQVMNMPLGTVKTGLFRAHAQLRQALEQQVEVW
jgi:RNA polymerase sigma-70 factor (ECF subfamily)